MTRSAFVVSVTDLVAEPGARRALQVGGAVDWALEAARVGPSISADLIGENASGTVVVRGTVATTAALACDRCLTEWTEDVVVELAEAIGIEGDDDGYVLDSEGDLDLEPVLRDAVLLAVPLRPLCRADCRGLCATCGADLNTGACPGHPEEPTTPFAVLRDLLEP